MNWRDHLFPAEVKQLARIEAQKDALRDEYRTLFNRARMRMRRARTKHGQETGRETAPATRQK